MPTDPNATMMKAVAIRTSASVKPRVPRSRRAALGAVVARPGKIEDVASGAPRFHQEEAAQPCRHVAEREILDQRSEPAQAPGEHGDDAERDLRTSPAESEKLTARNEEEPRVVR